MTSADKLLNRLAGACGIYEMRGGYAHWKIFNPVPIELQRPLFLMCIRSGMLKAQDVLDGNDMLFIAHPLLIEVQS